MTPYAWTTTQILTATGGSRVAGNGDAVFSGIGIDSRTIDPDHLFVAIAGEVHDGHRFVDDVLDRGLKGVIAGEAHLPRLPLERMRADGIVCVAVADTTRALGDLARFNRRRGSLKVLAVTGSNGKTSTRMFMERVVSETFATLGTRGNLNNHIGLPLTLLRLAPDHRVAVLELGMNHAGEITRLGRICEPDVGVITNVGPAHLEGLGSIEQVALAKAELLQTIRPGGTAILNADDPRVAAMAHGLDHPVVSFGTSPDAMVRAEDIRHIDTGLAFLLTTPSGRMPVTLTSPVRAMVSNALAAAAAGEVMGVPLEHIRAGIESFTPLAGRMGIRTPGRDIRLVDDTYNANPSSMAAAIESMAGMRASRRTIAVLGDMLELGPQSAELHRSVGRLVGEARIDRLYAAGDFASAVAEGARERHMAAEYIFCGTKEAIIDRLTHALRPGDLILVKGSRGMAMEQVVQAIVSWADAR